MGLRLLSQGAMCHLASDRPTVNPHALARMRRVGTMSVAIGPLPRIGHARPRRPSHDRAARASFTRHNVTEDRWLNRNRKRARCGQGLHCLTAGGRNVAWECGFWGGILASGSRRSGNRCGVAVRTAPTSRYSFRSRTSLRSSHCSVFCDYRYPRRRPGAPSAPTREAPEGGWNEVA